MKKLLLSLTALGIGASALNAQTRLSLYEEFSGENCAPCAASNPGLWTLLSGNFSKVILIKYQSPIPSAGPIYNAYKTVTNARLGYYSVPFAPYGRLNGTGLGTGTAASGSPGHVANLTQTDINNDYSVASPFNVVATHAWNATGDSVTATVNITSLGAFAPASANLKLRVALIEHLEYCNAPGTNGETEFHNVVREMYPDANGTQLPNSWTTSQTQTVTIKGKVPGYLDKANKDVRVVVWIQNDADKSVPQAAVSNYVALPVDASLKACTALELSCATSSVNVTSSVALTNTGSTPLTSATIYYNLDNGTWSSISWTGNLAAGATTSVPLPAQIMTVGVHTVNDSVALPNGNVDVNYINNTVAQRVVIRNSTVMNLPIAADFESGQAPANWLLFDKDGNGANWAVRAGGGHNGSIRGLYHNNYAFGPGEQNLVMMPNLRMTAGAKALDFWYAYAQYSNEDDRLEVVYSTNCGTSWTPIWGASGSALATHTPVSTAAYVPTEEDWRLVSLDASSIPDSAIIAFRATSDFGNNVFVDDVNVRAGNVGVEEVITQQSVSLHPNPARDAAQLEFSLNKAGKVSVVVYDAVGRVVATPFSGSMTQGAQRVNIATSGMAAGMYTINVNTESGKITQRLSVVK